MRFGFDFGMSTLAREGGGGVPPEPGNLIAQPFLASGWSALENNTCTLTPGIGPIPPGETIETAALVEDTTADGPRFAHLDGKLTKPAAALQYHIKVKWRSINPTPFTPEFRNFRLEMGNGPFTAWLIWDFIAEYGINGQVTANGFVAQESFFTDLGSGWWHSELVFTTDADTQIDLLLMMLGQGGTFYQGDGASGLYLGAVDLRRTG